MKDLKKIYNKPLLLLIKSLKKELRDQGHHNTGMLEGSMKSEVVIQGDAVNASVFMMDYGQILNDGTRPEKASMKQFYFLKEFFIMKGEDPKKAGAFAAATINKWMKEGMSTKASVRYSKNGRRRNFIGFVDEMISEELNRLIFTEVDSIVDQVYTKSKSETI